MPSEDEILEAIQGMKEESSPGPDGFSSRFFSFCWSVIREDFMEAVKGFFMGMSLPRPFAATLISLIQKVNQASSMEQMRPVSLCNTSHKIISRILATRLAKWLPLIISREQASFVKGRSIHKHRALSHDLTHDLKRKTFRGNLILKIDMAKAYDRKSWNFILKAFRSLGFGERWCYLIYQNILNCYYSVKWAGKTYGFFKSFRGVRKGEPLSPGLFWSLRNGYPKPSIRQLKTIRIFPITPEFIT